MAESATLTRWANRRAVVCPATLDTTARQVIAKIITQMFKFFQVLN